MSARSRSAGSDRSERSDSSERHGGGTEPASESPERRPEPSPESERGAVLLALARASVARGLGVEKGAKRRPPEAPWLREPGAVFITLMKGGNLRGCVGSLTAYRSLREDVEDNARAAAFRDPRFPSLAREELPEVRFEVSLLTPAVPLPPCATEEEAIRHLRPGHDGVVLDLRGQRATFLPQVWEQLPDPKTFLAHLKHKAGLDPETWSPDLRLSVYSVERWQEG